MYKPVESNFKLSISMIELEAPKNSSSEDDLYGRFLFYGITRSNLFESPSKAGGLPV